MPVLPVGTRRSLMKHPLGWIAAGFGAGFSPKAPGTVGSLAALLPWWFLLRDLPLPLYLGVLAATFAALAVIPILFLAQLAFIVAFGVLLDTFVVRSLLVPAAISVAAALAAAAGLAVALPAVFAYNTFTRANRLILADLDAFAHDLHLAGDMRTVLLGSALVLGSALSYAFYQAGSEPAIARLGAMRFSALALLVSTFATLAHFAATQPLAALQQPLPVYGHALGMAVFSTVLPVLMTSAAIRHIGAGRTALVGSLGPVMTIFFSAWLLGEALSWWQLGGAALVLSGVLLIGISRQRTTSRPAAAAQPAKPPHLAAHR